MSRRVIARGTGSTAITSRGSLLEAGDRGGARRGSPGRESARRRVGRHEVEGKAREDLAVGAPPPSLHARAGGGGASRGRRAGCSSRGAARACAGRRAPGAARLARDRRGPRAHDRSASAAPRAASPRPSARVSAAAPARVAIQPRVRIRREQPPPGLFSTQHRLPREQRQQHRRHQPLPEPGLVVLVGGQERVALEEEAAVVETEHLARRRAAVVDERARRAHAPASRRPERQPRSTSSR